MRRAIFALLAVTFVASSTGCCCLDKLFCWGCRGGCGYGYGHEGYCGGCGGCGSQGGGGCACSDCGMAGNSGGPGSSGMVRGGGPGGPGMARGPARGYPSAAMSNGRSRHPAEGHPFVRQRRDADGDYEFAAGPPTGSTTYPYYTTRGPRDFLARNPRDIGP